MNEKELVQNIEFFEDIALKNNFETTWSLYEVKDINDDSEITGDFMTDGYHKVKVSLPKGNLSYFQLWEYADKLFRLIGDTEHKFIEQFDVVKNNGKTEIQVFFGS